MPVISVRARVSDPLCSAKRSERCRGSSRLDHHLPSVGRGAHLRRDHVQGELNKLIASM